MSRITETLKIVGLFGLCFAISNYLPQSLSVSSQFKEAKNNEIKSSPSVISTKDRFKQQANTKLIEIANSFNLGSNKLTQEAHVESLWNNEKDKFTLNLESGKSYAILGICDQDCQDIDLTIYDQNLKIIDYDTADDHTPLVNIKPDHSSSYQVEIEMSQCSVSPCAYGVGIFEREN